MFVQLNQMNKKQIKTIAIGAGKGGVGKSSFTVNLAHMLKLLSLKVGIIDADLYGPSLSLMLPPEQPLRVDEAGTIFPAISRGIKVVSLSHFSQGREAMIVRAPIANATIKKFVTQVDWGDVDIVLIDLPPGTGDIQLTLMQSILLTGAIAITTPSKASTIDVKKSIEMFQRMNVQILGLVENMSYLEDNVTKERYYPFGEGGGKALSLECKIPFLGQIPLEEEISRSLDSGTSFFESARVTTAMKVFEEIAIEIRSKIWQDDGSLKLFEHVEKIDQHNFEVRKGDLRSQYRFSAIQRLCPCARCVDEVSGRSIVDPETLDENVSAIKIELLGNYAIKFHFTSGCSQGIYTWEYIEKSYSPSQLYS